MCGWRAGILSVCLSGIAAWFTVIKPQGHFAGISWQDGFALGLFLAFALTDVLLIASMRSAIRTRNELNAALELRVEERTKALLES